MNNDYRSRWIRWTDKRYLDIDPVDLNRPVSFERLSFISYFNGHEERIVKCKACWNACWNLVRSTRDHEYDTR